MSVKFTHKHSDGKACYVVSRRGGHRFDEVLLLTLVMRDLKAVQVAMAYLAYSNQWYLFDTTTGEEIGSFGGRSPLVDYYKYLVTEELSMGFEKQGC
jgi:hypothetical protein